MLFRDVPESQFLTKDSKFVYSEDDEHLKYIRHMNLRRNMPKYLSNKYGIDEPIDGRGGSISYEKMDYSYDSLTYNSWLNGPYGSDVPWTMDNWLNGLSTPDAYMLRNNRTSFRIYWNPNRQYSDYFYSRIEPVMHQAWRGDEHNYTTYTYTVGMVVSDMPASIIRVYFADSVSGHSFFPISGKTYEMRFKVRLHNLINNRTCKYYDKTAYMLEHPYEEPDVPRKLTGTFVNGISLSFIYQECLNGCYTDRHPQSGQTGLHTQNLFYYEGMYHAYDHPTPGTAVENDYPYSSGPQIAPRPSTIVPQYRDGDPHVVHEIEQWGMTWRDIPDWELLRVRDALSMNEDDVRYYSQTQAYRTYGLNVGGMYNSYFIRFGDDSDWHEVVLTYYPEDYFRLDGQEITYLAPQLQFSLAGLEPTTVSDSYVEVKDLTIRSKPLTQSTTQRYNNIEHFYLNKEGVWLPDNFERTSDNDIIQVRTEGTKIATGIVNGQNIDIFSPPVVTNASVTTPYQSGVRIASLLVDGTTYDIYTPYQTINDGIVYSPVEWSPTPLEFDILNGQSLKLLSVAPSGMMLDNEGTMFAHLDYASATNSFGLAELNTTRTYNVNCGNGKQGSWLCEITLDISTAVAYVPDDSTEYLMMQIRGSSSGFYPYASGNTYIEKRIPMDIFKNGPLDHYKIRKTFIYYCSDYMILPVTIKGKLKSGASLVTSENLTLKFKARKVTFS